LKYVVVEKITYICNLKRIKKKALCRVHKSYAFFIVNLLFET